MSYITLVSDRSKTYRILVLPNRKQQTRHGGDTLNPPRLRDQAPCMNVRFGSEADASPRVKLLTAAGKVCISPPFVVSPSNHERRTVSNQHLAVHSLRPAQTERRVEACGEPVEPGSGRTALFHSFPSRLLKKSENHPNPSFRRKPESSILMISMCLIIWTPAFAGVTKLFSAPC